MGKIEGNSVFRKIEVHDLVGNAERHKRKYICASIAEQLTAAKIFCIAEAPIDNVVTCASMRDIAANCVIGISYNNILAFTTKYAVGAATSIKEIVASPPQHIVVAFTRNDGICQCSQF